MKPLKLLFTTLLLLSSQLQAKTLDEFVNDILATNNFEPIVNELFNEKKDDLPFLNRLRLQLKAKGATEKSVSLFKKL